MAYRSGLRQFSSEVVRTKFSLGIRLGKPPLVNPELGFSGLCPSLVISMWNVSISQFYQILSDNNSLLSTALHAPSEI